jgi:hypothetical protein
VPSRKLPIALCVAQTAVTAILTFWADRMAVGGLFDVGSPLVRRKFSKIVHSTVSRDDSVKNRLCPHRCCWQQAFNLRFHCSRQFF